MPWSANRDIPVWLKQNMRERPFTPWGLSPHSTLFTFFFLIFNQIKITNTSVGTLAAPLVLLTPDCLRRSGLLQGVWQGGRRSSVHDGDRDSIIHPPNKPGEKNFVAVDNNATRQLMRQVSKKATYAMDNNTTQHNWRDRQQHNTTQLMR